MNYMKEMKGKLCVFRSGDKYYEINGQVPTRNVTDYHLISKCEKRC